MKEIRIAGKVLRLLQGDITRQETDAIVNAANSRLAGGGGVDGAIHREGGPDIMKECDAIRAEKGGCPTGEAVITTAGRLPSKWVIHTVGPIWRGGSAAEQEKLAGCYSSCMKLAESYALRSVSFPSISTGAYGYPVERAAMVALETAAAELRNRDIDEVRFVLFSAGDLDVYAAALDRVVEGGSGSEGEDG